MLHRGKVVSLAALAALTLGLAACSSSGGSSSVADNQANDSTQSDGVSAPSDDTATDDTAVSEAPSDDESSADTSGGSVEVSFQYTDSTGWHYTASGITVEPRTLTMAKDISQSPPGQARLSYTVSGDPVEGQTFENDNPGRENNAQLQVGVGAVFPLTQAESWDHHTIDEDWFQDIDATNCSWDYENSGRVDYFYYTLHRWACGLSDAGTTDTETTDEPESVIDQFVAVSPLQGKSYVSVAGGSPNSGCWFWVDPASATASLPTADDIEYVGDASGKAANYADWKKNCPVSDITVSAS